MASANRALNNFYGSGGGIVLQCLETIASRLPDGSNELQESQLTLLTYLKHVRIRAAGYPELVPGHLVGHSIYDFVVGSIISII